MSSVFTVHAHRNMDKMYQARSDDSNDKDLLNSSFWSDGEREEEQNQEEVQAVGQGGAEPTVESGRETLKDEKPAMKLYDWTEESSEDATSDDDDDDDDDDYHWTDVITICCLQTK